LLVFLQTLNEKILSFNGLNDKPPNDENNGNGKYTNYNKGVAPLIYPPASKIPAFNTQNDLNKVSSPPSIITFAKWCKDNKSKISDPKTGIVYFVSHSHIMQAFVKKVINLNVLPDASFKGVFDVAKKTNSWSLFFKVDGTNFKGFRHAFSCDNRYAEKGLVKIFHRIFLGSYTNLALWGILSTAIFAQRKIPGLIQDNLPQSLKVSVGMKKETKELVGDKFDKYNMLCGKQDDRFKTGNFEITLGNNCGTSSNSKLTLDNDCIKIKCRQDNGTFYPQKVILKLSKTTTPPQIGVTFFNDDSNTYRPQDNTDRGDTSLLKIVSFLSEIPITDVPIEPGNYPELDLLSLELKNEISNSIKSDVFKKTKNNAMWDKAFQPFFSEIEKKVIPENDDFSGGGGRGLFGRRTKKMRKYKKYTKKYYTYQSRRQSRRYFQRRKRTHIRKSRRSRK
jgi:hypothetical protein